MPNLIDTNDFEYFEPIPGLRAKVVHTADQTYAFWEIDAGTILPSHQHFHAQVSIVTKGTIALTIDGVTTEMQKGMVALIPPNTVHSAKAITDVELTDVFTPVREDFPNYQTGNA